MSTAYRAIQTLLSGQGKFDDNLLLAMASIGIAAEVDRTYVFQIRHEASGRPLVSQLAEWSRVTPMHELFPTKDVPIDDVTPGWVAQLSSGRCVNSRVKAMSEAERKTLESQGIVSLLIAPIIRDNQLWGFIGFDDCKRERVWSTEEESILRATGTLIETAISQARANEAVKFSEKRFQDVVKASGEVVWEIDNNERISFISDRCRDICGWSASEMHGMKTTSLAGTRKYHDKIVAQIKRQVQKKGFFRDIEHEVVRKGGEISYLRSSGIFTHDQDGKLASVRGSSFNITDERKSKKRLNDALSALRLANEELSQYAASTQILAAQADAANRAKSEFLANIGHEVRTPINVITGMAYLALRSSLTEKQKKQINKIHAAGAALLDIMNNILDFARIESNELKLESHSLRLADVLRGAISGLDDLCRDKDLGLSILIDPDIPPILQGDPGRFGQIFKNIVHNAVKFTDKGAVEIQCLLDARMASTVRLRCVIADSGKGMSPAELEQVFIPFTQADGSSTRRFGGTGVGLALAKKLIEAMNGSISIKSQPGIGTTVTFTAEMQLCEKDAAKTASLEINPDDPGLDMSDIHVCVLAADQDAERALYDLLQHMGVHVTLAYEAEELKELLDSLENDSCPYDAAFLGMPKDGLETGREYLKIARSHPVFASLPIIAFGGWTALGPDTLKEAGIDELLDNRQSIAKVEQQIRHWVGKGANLRKGQMGSKQKTPHADPGSPTITPEFLTALAKLEVYLKDDDAESSRVASSIKKTLAHIAPKPAENLLTAISVFDFSKALEHLDQIWSTIKARQ